MSAVHRAAILAGAVALLLGSQDAGAARIALLQGNDHGHAGDVQLRYAERDATRLAALFGRIGGFAADGTAVALGRTAGEVERALDDLAARLRITPGDNLIVVYYSGHADSQGLHLGALTLPLGDLKARIAALPAATRS